MNIPVLAGHAFDIRFAPSVGHWRHIRVGDGHILHGRVGCFLYLDAYLVKVMVTRLKFEFIEGKGIVKIAVFLTEQVVVYR